MSSFALLYSDEQASDHNFSDRLKWMGKMMLPLLFVHLAQQDCRKVSLVHSTLPSSIFSLLF